MRGEREKLKVFGGVSDRKGFVEKLDVTLRELRQYGHTAAGLREMAGAEGMEAGMGRRLGDLAVLLEAWSGVMEGSEVWDFEKIMLEAAVQVDRGESALVNGARVWVDGFSAMSTLEMRMLLAMGKVAEEMTVTLLADPDGRGIRELRCGGEEMGVFARTERLYCRMVDAFRAEGVRMEGVVGLRERYRFRDELVARVERELFENGDDRNTKTRRHEGSRREKKLTTENTERKREGGQRDLFSSSVNSVVHSDRGVEVWRCSDLETEVRVVAQGIRERVLKGGIRYREMGVIVPELEGYQDAVGRIFAEHRIPFFIDQRRGIAHHPLVELLRSAVAMETSRWDQDEVMLYLKTGLVGVSEEEVAVVENYVIGHGITRVSWERAWKWVAPNQREEDAEDGVEVPEEGAGAACAGEWCAREGVAGVEECGVE